MSNAINVKVEKQRGYISFNRPDKRNALSTSVILETIEALKKMESDSEVKVIIISGEGPAFSAGGDIGTMEDLMDSADIASWINKAFALTKTIRELEKYVIAAVHGFAAGAGFSLALASDFLIADRSAKFSSSFSNIGLIPDLGLTKLLTDSLPLPLAKEWAASGKAVSAEVLFQWGLINRITDGDIIQATEEFSEFLIDGSPLSQLYEKKLLQHASDLSFDSALAQESIAQALLLKTEDHKEGVAAFLEKRPPAFKGK
ncbi:enoyl-CoA hydratase/isomerase family protein [Thalassobacillus sp. C254]|uniref:enoyl-CoA hydratase/isomerase family protein n=1 Tax=Thalassobacillus sp. C254 TaxID=1225341 RepID=UPI0006D1ACFE|nr:enoyl-CoA hydratase/isomerase family protein [Thalassobacillus sp. C254]